MTTVTLETPTDATMPLPEKALDMTAPSPVDALFDAEHRSISSRSSSSETSNMSGRPAMRNSTTQTPEDGAADGAPRKLKAKRPSFKLFSKDQKEKADDKDKADDKFKKRKGITSMLRKEKSEGHKRSSSSMTGDELGKKEKRKSFLEILGLSDYEGDEPTSTKPRSGNNLNVLGFSDDERPPTASSKRRNRLSLNLSDLLSLSDADSADEGRGVDQPDKRRKRLSMSISDLFQRRRGGSDGRISPVPHQDAFYPQRAATPGPYDDVQQQRPDLPRSLSEQPYRRGRSSTNSTGQSSPGADGEDVSAPVTPSTSVDEPLHDEIEHQQQQEARHDVHPKRHQQGPLPPAITTRPTRHARAIFNDEPLVPSPVAIHITPPPSPDEPRRQTSLRSALRSSHQQQQQQDAPRGPSVTPSIETVMLRQLEVSERLEESLRRLETRVDGQREEIGEILTSRYEDTIRRLEEKVNTQSKELEVLREGLREVVSDLYPGQSRLLEIGHTHSFGNQSRQIPNQQQQQLVSASSNYTLVNSLVVKPIRNTVSTSYEMGKNVLHTLYVRPVVIIWNTLMPSNNDKSHGKMA